MNEQFSSRASARGQQRPHVRRIASAVADHLDFDTLLENLDSLQPFLQRFDRARHRRGRRRVNRKRRQHRRNRRIVGLSAIRRSPNFDDQKRTKLGRQCSDNLPHQVRDTLAKRVSRPAQPGRTLPPSPVARFRHPRSPAAGDRRTRTAIAGQCATDPLRAAFGARAGSAQAADKPRRSATQEFRVSTLRPVFRLLDLLVVIITRVRTTMSVAATP